MDEGCAWKVVVRAYTICLLCVGQRLDGAAVHFIVLPQARARQWAGGCQPDGNSWLPPLLRTGVIPRTTQRLVNEHLSVRVNVYCCEHAGGASMAWGT